MQKFSLKTELKEVLKIWGKEVWIVNEPEYCAKFLYLNKAAASSLHYHLQKKETFYCLEGSVALQIEGRDYMLNSFARPKTILSEVKHRFWGITKAVILEISTHHDDGDVVRLEESRSDYYSHTL